MQQIKVIAFDADDTLWDNQVFYDKVESEFCHLLAGYGTAEEISSLSGLSINGSIAAI